MHSLPLCPFPSQCQLSLLFLLEGPGTEEGASCNLCFLMSPFRHTLSCLRIAHYDKWIISYSLHLLIIDKTAGIQL